MKGGTSQSKKQGECSSLVKEKGNVHLTIFLINNRISFYVMRQLNCKGRQEVRAYFFAVKRSVHISELLSFDKVNFWSF